MKLNQGSARTVRLAKIYLTSLSLALCLWSGVAWGNGHGTQNHMSAFVGTTTHGEQHGMTIGLDYEYTPRLTHGLIKVGLLLDAAFLEHTDVVAGISVSINPVGGLRIAAAPVVTTDFHSLNVGFRGTVGYNLPLGRFSVGPTASVDYVHGTLAYVYGLAIGTGY